MKRCCNARIKTFCNVHKTLCMNPDFTAHYSSCYHSKPQHHHFLLYQKSSTPDICFSAYGSLFVLETAARVFLLELSLYYGDSLFIFVSSFLSLKLNYKTLAHSQKTFAAFGPPVDLSHLISLFSSPATLPVFFI